MQKTQETYHRSPPCLRTSLKNKLEGLVPGVAQVLEDSCTRVCNSSVVVIVNMNFKVHRTFVLTLLALPFA